MIALACWFDNPLPPPIWRALDLDGLAAPARAPEGVETIRLVVGSGDPGLLLLNHGDGPAAVQLDGEMESLLDGAGSTRHVTLGPLDVAILRHAARG